jgi:hypothetical protein
VFDFSRARLVWACVSIDCSSCSIRPSVASRFRSERFDAAPTRNPMNSSATVVTRFKGKLKPCEVNQAGSQSPLPMREPPSAKMRVQAITATSQIMMLVGRPIAADVQSATRWNIDA